MRKDVLILGGTALVLVVAAVAGGTYYARTQAPKPERAPAAVSIDKSRLERPHSPSQGRADAKVTVVEFLDPECGTCRAMSPIVKNLLVQYGGQVRLVARHMAFHRNSLFAITALYAAAEQGKYWELLEALFENQPEWGNPEYAKPELIPEFARRLGLNMDAFSAALSNVANKQKVEADEADGKALGVDGTPTFFVNGKLLEELGYDQLKAMIDQALAKS